MSFGQKTSFLVALFASLVLVAFFLGPFYWFGSNAGWANFLRIGAVLALGLLVWRDWPLHKPDSFQIVFLLFWVYLALNSIVLSEDAQPLRRLVFILCFVLMVSRVGLTSVHWRWVIAGVGLLGAGFALFSLANLYRLGMLSFEYRSGTVFSSGVPEIAYFGNTIVAALHYAVCYCAALWMFFSSRTRSALLGWGGCVLVISAYLFLTYARSGWIAALIVSCVLWVLMIDRQRWRRYVLFASFMVGGATFFLFKYSAYEFGVRGLTHRDEIWRSVLAQALPNWFWGKGAGADIAPVVVNMGAQTVRNTHSLYLEIFYQFGLLGLLLVVIILFFALLRLLKLSKEKIGGEISVFAFALLSAASVVMFFEMNTFVGTPNLVWLWFWLPLGVALSSYGRANA
ncbi:O-antigen ligase family protein [Stutzerimonas stutzeri]|uniref:O-antigen ligase family protein n=1 Tax=Stutzerimonas stutzeri TaxID=316 RepID=UPI00177EA933|nr:O-antigen ligase family protein [Stutzerimonas stutzeri]MBD9408769.1 hypothetical protein [Stutzerimonas stutzeri]